MITRVRIPKLSANVEEAALTGWMKKEGDSARKGETLAELTTDKIALELPAPRSGVVRRILAPEKSVLPVGYVIALIGPESDPLPDVDAANRALLEKHRRRIAAPERPRRTGRGSARAVRATPAARRLAREWRVDLARLARETGVRLITESVVRQHAQRSDS